MRFFTAGLGLSAVLLAVAPAFGAPFGVDFSSTTPTALGCKKLLMPNRYSCDSMPDQSWSMRDYALAYSDERGLCTISANGPLIESGPDGAAVRAAISAFKDQLAQTYGEPDLHGGSFDGRPLDDGRTWMAQVGGTERQYFYSWSFDPPRDGVDSMVLMASSDGATQGSYQLQVDAPGAFQCFMGN